MTINEWVALLAPLASAGAGVLSALFIFVKQIRSLKGVVKSQLTDSLKVAKELAEVKQVNVDINQKLAVIMETLKEKTNDKTK